MASDRISLKRNSQISQVNLPTSLSRLCPWQSMVLHWPFAANPLRQGKSTVRSNWLSGIYIQKLDDGQGESSESVLTKRDLGINPAFRDQITNNHFSISNFQLLWLPLTAPSAPGKTSSHS
jgi:hypothetical protein